MSWCLLPTCLCIGHLSFITHPFWARFSLPSPTSPRIRDAQGDGAERVTALQGDGQGVTVFFSRAPGTQIPSCRRVALPHPFFLSFSSPWPAAPVPRGGGHRGRCHHAHPGQLVPERGPHHCDAAAAGGGDLGAAREHGEMGQGHRGGWAGGTCRDRVFAKGSHCRVPDTGVTPRAHGAVREGPAVSSPFPMGTVLSWAGPSSDHPFTGPVLPP